MKKAGQRVACISKLASVTREGQFSSQKRKSRCWLVKEGRKRERFSVVWDADAEQALRMYADRQLGVCESGRTEASCTFWEPIEELFIAEQVRV